MTEFLKFKKSNCKNCYKCIRNCPVKSIRFSENQANIIHEECVLCGHCVLGCPQNAKEIRNDLDSAKKILNSGKPVYASIAPSFIANYDNVTIKSIEEALIKLGFAGVEETAVGATIVKKQYENIILNKTQDVIISSCCPSINMLIQKHYAEALQYLAPVMSPMHIHCKDLKRRYPDSKTIFIGPCIAKKAEAAPNDVDCALTFEELSEWLASERVNFNYAEEKNDNTRARLFPTTGGILRTMPDRDPSYAYIAVDGIENSINVIEDIIKGNISKCFIEMSACTGSCIGGPAMDKAHRAPVRDYVAVNSYAGIGDYPVYDYKSTQVSKKYQSMAALKINISDSAIEDVLRQMGKTKPEHELNCGSCGYHTCREKALAVIYGKATITMCLPYLKDKAESFSDTIIKNTPNAVIVLNENFEVQQINISACNLINVRNPQNVIGEQVVRILDPKPFIDAYQSKRNIYNNYLYLPEYRKYVDQSILYDNDYHIIICVMRDVTDEVREREKKEQISRNTIETTDRVIEKQMRTIQEIASLLGETTAETKVALTKLKESLKNE